MNEPYLVERTTDFMGLFLSGIGLSFTVVSAYIGALFYFLHRSPLVLRMVTFLFFTALLAMLGVFLFVSHVYYLSLLGGFEAAAARAPLGPFGAGLYATMQDIPTRIGLYAPWAIGSIVYVLLGYFTFAFNWTRFELKSHTP